MKLRPTGNKILVSPLPVPDVTAGGIVFPTPWQQPSGRGTVLAVGQRVSALKPGDQVLYSWIEGLDVQHEGRTCRLLETANILGVIE